MKRTLTCLLAAALCVSGCGRPEAAATPPPRATADIVRGDLTDTLSLSGKVVFAGFDGLPGGRTVRARAAGTVTALPAPGAVVRQGQALYRVDRKPVVLLYGRLPLYRPLGQGVKDGPDVRQLETALKALGHAEDVTVDDHFTWATTLAVRAWQKHAGLPGTGSVDAAQAVFLPAEVRIAKAAVAPGDSVAHGAPVLTVTRTGRRVHLNLDVADQALARRGAKVEVELPGGATARGTVVSVGATARTREGVTTVDVGVRLAGAKVRLLDQTPVTVTLESVTRRDVLSVPVEALLATPGGGYGLEIGGRTVPVTTGVYGGGRVEISGPGLAAGMKAGVPVK
ncbi:peptidoglycan-binding protein [Nonomuraea typhae]|uniref:peptidoglycan-binding protein n=1 Tax=Nonomuraea typhae TaxID=2603600 RepID=UPI0012FC53FD|nr:peptidoglycan-binding protein [Nonomuraea typhae]